ncbi:MAG: hypothetical protein UR61_C0032G0009 [candidate division WS6 bacterium GW2011_GWE1_34_7]|uniref:Radical SAM domain protein n=1 Tax=candidate division WS6 bacterium GW2011_GWE1_34_7 TaxID=1619093 RepID=A0A0G0DQ49_9BACT|nr:MAG: hypothetical protein UR61_C0032G0009 [candidate division WS6 bacterium GW2011_GWE1_34_7]
MNKIFEIVKQFNDRKIYLYTNGYYLNDKLISDLFNLGICGINIGIHNYENVEYFIESFIDWKLIRFHIEDIYIDKIEKQYLNRFKFWHRNSCDMPNEDWYYLLD